MNSHFSGLGDAMTVVMCQERYGGKNKPREGVRLTAGCEVRMGQLGADNQ